jgi:hypothetical protein
MQYLTKSYGKLIFSGYVLFCFAHLIRLFVDLLREAIALDFSGRIAHLLKKGHNRDFYPHRGFMLHTSLFFMFIYCKYSCKAVRTVDIRVYGVRNSSHFVNFSQYRKIFKML